MEFLGRAIEALKQVEAELRAAMSASSAAQEYKQTAMIAALADSLSALLRQHAGGRATPVSRATGSVSILPVTTVVPGELLAIPAADLSPAVRVEPQTRPAGRKRAVPPRSGGRTPKKMPRRVKAHSQPIVKPDGLPRFEREADRLVKIGWSERDRRVYEHKVPRAVVFEFVRLVRDKAGADRPFTMDDILPLKDGTGKEWPSYQAYLALAWLRAVGAIQRVGNEGYSATADSLDGATLEGLWNALQSRDVRPLLEQSSYEK